MELYKSHISRDFLLFDPSWKAPVLRLFIFDLPQCSLGKALSPGYLLETVSGDHLSSPLPEQVRERREKEKEHTFKNIAGV